MTVLPFTTHISNYVYVHHVGYDNKAGQRKNDLTVTPREVTAQVAQPRENDEVNRPVNTAP